ncbi:DUF501 domain-containing protein [bacterium]|jgi:hypothetical protein|nr:DUF501 domain-containing protein [bacterium]
MNSYQLQYKGFKATLKFPVQSVGTECPFEAPVTLVHSKAGDEFYSRSAYWILCPKLVRDIRELESKGWISILEELIQGPLKRRWSEFISQVPDYLEETLEQDYFQSLIREGRAHIGGVKNPFHIKCLHAHYSFYLLHGRGFIGEFTHGLLTWKHRRSNPHVSGVYCQPTTVECSLGAAHDQRTLYISNGHADAGGGTQRHHK